MRVITLFIYLFTFLLCQISLAQETVLNAKKVGDFNTAVTAITQDEDGFLWLGTWFGVMRYDGQAFKQFKPEKDNPWSIKGRKIHDVKADGKGRIWIGSNDNGLMVYDKETNRFKSFQEYTGIDYLFNSVKCLYIDSVGNIWVGTLNGLVKISTIDSGNISVHTFTETQKHDITHITEIDNEIWFGTNKGVYRIKTSNLPDTNLKIQKVVDKVKIIGNTYIFKLIHNNDNIIIASSKGIYEYKKRTSELDGNLMLELKSIIKKRKAGTMYPKHIWQFDNTSYFYDMNNKIVKLSNQKIKIINLKTPSENYVPIKSMLKCADQHLWIGTENGLWQVSSKPSSFIDYKDIISKEVGYKSYNVSDIASIGSKLFLSSNSQGLIEAKINNKGEIKDFRKYQSGNSLLDNHLEHIKKLFADADGRLWLGINGVGVFIGEIGEKENLTIKNLNELQNQNIAQHLYLPTCFAQLPNKNLLIGTYDGNILLLSPDFKLIKLYNNLKSQAQNKEHPNLTCLLVESDQVIWLGTKGDGLLRMDISQDQPVFKVFKTNPQNSISDNFIIDLTFDHLGGLWIATENGLDLFDRRNNTFINISEEDGLPDNRTHGVIEDNLGNVWVTTVNGIAKIDPLYTSQSKSFSKGIKTYTLDDGFSSNYFNVGSCHLSPSGKIIFGGKKSICTHTPQATHEYVPKSKMYFKDLFINQYKIDALQEINKRTILQKAISFQDSIYLKPEENHFTVSFGVIAYSPNDPTKYAYRLKGLHDDWYYTDYKDAKANYTNLPAGHLTFELKATNIDGSWSEDIQRLYIHKKPIFWKTSSAYFIYLTFLSLLIFVTYRLIKYRYSIKEAINIEVLKREQAEENFIDNTRFFTNISHELKTPLSLIIGPLKSVLNNSKLTDIDNKPLKTAYRNAARLQELVDQILEFRKAEISNLKLSVSKQSFSQLIQKIYEDFNYLAKQKNITLSLEELNTDIEVWIDFDKVKKIIYNVLSNAIKYTPEGKSVGLNCSIHENNSRKTLICTVTDTGEGIAEDKLEKVFEHFYQINKTQGGFGIGLALSKRLVELHKGQINLKSKIGEGSVFTFEIPVNKSAYSEAEILNEQLPISEFEYNYNSEELATEFEVSQDKPALLIVEDDTELRTFIQGIFINEFRTIVAANGAEAVEFINKEKPSIIISDLMMPKMDGIELIKHIKSKHETNNIPVILLTADSDSISHKKSLEVGANLYINKPFDPDLLRIQAINLFNQTKLIENHIHTEMITESNIIPKKSNTFEDKLISTIEKNISNENLNVDELAKLMNLSRTQLYRKVKEQLQISPIDILRKTRIKHAAELLKDRNINISESAIKSGFADMKNFRECFKREFGVTPSEYKKKIHN